MSNTSLSPYTMVIKFINTMPASTTMRNSGHFVKITFLTSFICKNIFGINYFILHCVNLHDFWHFIHFISNTISLNITPKTHQNIKPCQMAQNLRLLVTSKRIQMLCLEIKTTYACEYCVKHNTVVLSSAVLMSMWMPFCRTMLMFASWSMFVMLISLWI